MSEITIDINDYDTQIKWAVEQLELGMQRVGTTQDQKDESLEVIGKLTSTTKSKTEKLILMRQVFGDFKQWMITTEEMRLKDLKDKEKKKLKREKQKEKKKQSVQSDPKIDSIPSSTPENTQN
jgi:hypothetical protein